MDGELLRRDVHPAEVAMPDGTVHRALRVFVTSHRLIAYSEAPGDGELFKRVVDEPLLHPWSVPADRSTLSRNGRLECRLAAGVAWVNRDAGCGCGSRLKHLAAPAPWRTA